MISFEHCDFFSARCFWDLSILWSVISSLFLFITEYSFLIYPLTCWVTCKFFFQCGSSMNRAAMCIYRSLCGNMFYFSWWNLGVKLLCRVSMGLTLSETIKLSKVVVSFYILTSNVWVIQFLCILVIVWWCCHCCLF